MTELEKHLLEALEQAQAQQQQREADLLKMFESTKQDNFSVRKAFKDFLDNMRETDQTRSTNLSNLVRQVSNLNDQLEGFKTQNSTLTKQLQVLEMQVSKLKK
ncbi:MbeD/MobD family mobilization/exclusion protein [Acinetobacter sp. ANC 4470]|uniref:MbeD/MobD family mobilization/exclusion protein n=1 Tax=Acinetobacter sp. ANC 4470 TaxID=1977881 RepID=UPI003A0FC429